MKNGKFIVLFAGLLLAAWQATPLRSAAEGRQDKPAGDERSKESIAVRYARATAQLARVALREAQETNRNAPHTFPQTEMNRLNQGVQVAEERLKIALDSSSRGFHLANLLFARTAIQVAEADYSKALKANELVKGTVGATELERLKLTIETAKLGLERLQTFGDDPASRLVEAQWEIEHLRDEVLRLRDRVEQLSDLN
jgi:hypothetical protein